MSRASPGESRNETPVQGEALRKVLLWCWLTMSAAGLAASDEDFYQRLYQRGMTHFAAADYAAAFTELRSAAFGFVEMVEQFEMAQSYACLAAHRLGRESDARDSLMRIVTAEKLQPRYRSIKLPDSVRAEVNAIAANLLTEQEAVLLGVTAAAKPTIDVATPAKQPNVAVIAPHEGGPDVPGSAGAPPAAYDAHAATRPAGKTTAVPATSPQRPLGSAGVPPAADGAPLATKPPGKMPALPATTAQPSAGNVDASLADAQRAIDSGDIAGARSIYNALSNASSLSHDATLRVAEGLYRVSDFAGAARTFARAGAIGRGEDRYRYSYAVALYETGRYGDAKRELAAGLPFITMTPDVARYRAKIEGAIE